MHILVLAPRHPYPAERGDQRRVLHLVDEFSRRARVTLLCFGRGDLPVPGVRLVALRRSPPGTVWANLRHPAPLTPLQTRLYLDQRMQRAVAAELETGGVDVVHATTARMAPYLRPRSAGVHRHLDLIDALSINMATRASAERGLKRVVFRMESALMRRFESAAVAAADTCSLVADADRRAVPGLERAVVVPMGVDLSRFPFVAPSHRPPVLLFSGNLGYFHNVEPARFLAEEVLPRVRAEIPAARLRIVGARPAKAVLALAGPPGVEVIGRVTDMAAELQGAAVAVAPMFTGSGIKIKVLEAFSSGTPVVANARGIEGVDGARDGTHYLEAEGPADLAAACVAILRDPGRAQALATAGRALIEERYTWAVQADRLLSLYAAGRG